MFAGTGGGSSEDLIASAYFEFVDRNQRKNGHEIISELRDQFDNIKELKLKFLNKKVAHLLEKMLK